MTLGMWRLLATEKNVEAAASSFNPDPEALAREAKGLRRALDPVAERVDKALAGTFWQNLIEDGKQLRNQYPQLQEGRTLKPQQQ